MSKIINLPKKTNSVGNESKKLSGVDLCKAGQYVGNQIISILSEWGSSKEGLIIETYAMGVAWAGLAAIAKDKGYDPTDLFLNIAESYEEDMNEIVKEVDND
jgi:hypothetical protein